MSCYPGLSSFLGVIMSVLFFLCYAVVGRTFVAYDGKVFMLVYFVKSRSDGFPVLFLFWLNANQERKVNQHARPKTYRAL